MTKLKRSAADCSRLRALHAKAAGYPFPPANPAHAAAGYGFTQFQDDVKFDSADSSYNYDLPTDFELGAVDLARLTGSERSELALIRSKPDVTGQAAPAAAVAMVDSQEISSD